MGRSKRVRRNMVEAMMNAGVPPHLIFAYERTGICPGERDLSRMAAHDRADWEAAIQEYFDLAHPAKV
jgi:hypothetical protein